MKCLPVAMCSNAIGMRPVIALLALIFSSSAVLAQPEEPVSLEKRIETARVIFLGKLIKREEKNGCIHAELLVEKPVYGVIKGQKIRVIWKMPENESEGDEVRDYDIEMGARGVAIMDATYRRRFLIAEEQFLPEEKFVEIWKLSSKRLQERPQ